MRILPSQVLSRTFILDVLRGLAALYVLIGHARWLLWEGYTEGYKLHPEAYTSFDKILVYVFSIFSFGHEAVMLFFVLSGFVIHYSSYNSFLRSGDFSIREYFYKRLKRIYPPFLFALLLTWIIDATGRSFGYTIYSGATYFPVMNASIHSDLSWETLLVNLCMIQTMYKPVWGSNGPLWSLMYECWFYVLYIPIFFINKRYPLPAAYLTGSIFLVSLFVTTYEYRWVTVIHYFFAWYLGVLAADCYMGRVNGIKNRGFLTVYICAVFVSATYITDYLYMRDFYIAACLVVVLYVALKFYTSLKWLYILQPLSNFSYTLYIIHFPILIFLSGWLQHRLDGALPMHFGYVFSCTLICLLFAWAVHFLVEQPFVKKAGSKQ